MEGLRDTAELDDENPPTFAEVLTAVVKGKILGFYVMDDEGDISYSFRENEDELDPLEPGELRLPMTREQAQEMLDELSADELHEIGHRSEGLQQGGLN
jgi:hypothetical protein